MQHVLDLYAAPVARVCMYVFWTAACSKFPYHAGATDGEKKRVHKVMKGTTAPGFNLFRYWHCKQVCIGAITCTAAKHQRRLTHHKNKQVTSYVVCGCFDHAIQNNIPFRDHHPALAIWRDMEDQALWALQETLYLKEELAVSITGQVPPAAQPLAPAMQVSTAFITMVSTKRYDTTMAYSAGRMQLNVRIHTLPEHVYLYVCCHCRVPSYPLVMSTWFSQTRAGRLSLLVCMESAGRTSTRQKAMLRRMHTMRDKF